MGYLADEIVIEARPAPAEESVTALIRRLKALEDYFNSPASPADPPDETGEEMHSLVTEIVRTPALTLEEVRLKLNECAIEALSIHMGPEDIKAWLKTATYIDICDNYEEDALLLSAVIDLRRMAG